MAAPAGNKYAIGNKGGRPALYDTPEELADAVDAYFVYCEGEFNETEQEQTDKKGDTKTVKVIEWIRYPEKHTVTGLCLFLGFSSRTSLDIQEERGKEFMDVIKRARLRVEHSYEKQLYTDISTGAIFALKNMKWKDKQEIEQTTKVITVITEPEGDNED